MSNEYTSSDASSLKVELATWQEIYRETVKRGGSIAKCEQIIRSIQADLDAIRPSDSPPPLSA